MTALVSFVSGAATGVAIGMLFAPNKGREIRDRLSFRMEKYREMIGDLTDAITANRDINVPSAAQSEGQRVVKDAKDKADKLLGDVDSLINQINSRKEA